MKKFVCAAIAAVAAVTVAFGGCFLGGTDGAAGADGKDGKNGMDGRDGQDASVYDYYELAKTVEGQENMTVDEFLKKYMSYTPAQLEEAFSEQRNANRSLLSAVSILTTFTVTSSTVYGGSYTYDAVYSGAGVIVDIDREKGDAYVVTNCHVVYNDLSSTGSYISSDVRLYLYGQDTENVNYKLQSEYVNKSLNIYTTSVLDDEDYRIEARVVAASVAHDIALLKVTGSDVLKNSEAIAAEFEDSDEVYVKESVYAVGNPAGDGMSVTSGTIVKERQIIQLNLSEKYSQSVSHFNDYRVIGTDTAINGGNSGGGLFSAKTGKLVGIVNSKNAQSEIDNMGYALPGSAVKRLWQCMRDDFEGRTGGAYAKSTGVKYALFPATTEITNSGAYWDNEKQVAVIEEQVTVTGAKSSSGFKIGDIVKHLKITDISGKTVEDGAITRLYQLEDRLISARAGYTVEVTVMRGGVETKVSYQATLSSVK